MHTYTHTHWSSWAIALALIGMLLMPFSVLAHGDSGIQPAANPALQASCGLDIVLVLDSSGSVDPSDLTTMQNAFKGFVDALMPNETEMAVVDFDDPADVLLGFSSDPTAIKNAIDQPTSGGNTNWDDALFEARSLFTHRANPDLIIFASDGNPNEKGDHAGGSSTGTDLEAAIGEANLAKNAGIHIQAIGIGAGVNVANLEAISSPGEVITSDFAQLGTDLAALADELCEEPPVECDCDGDTKVINKNKGMVKNYVVTRSSTGGNSAGGSEGGDGGNGGDIYNGGQSQEEHDGDIRNVTTGSGGNGGAGGTGGTVITSAATSITTILNQINWNRIIIRR